MSSRKKKISIAVFAAVFLLFFVAALVSSPTEHHESIKEVMRDAVLHETGKIGFLGGMTVNPALISAYVVTGMILIAALLIRLLVIPKFSLVPGKIQMLLEEAVNLFRGMAHTNSPDRNKFLGAYIFAAGTYIFIGTLFELLGLQGVTTEGHSIALPAPLADINGAIAMGFMSYAVILVEGIVGNGFRGAVQALKDFSLPISMSFRLFGALLSGALVTELVYYFYGLSFGIPVIVGVMFTLIHALIQAYVLTMLVSVFHGEATEKHHKEKLPQAPRN